MVENVVGIEAELRFDALGDGEVLRQRHVIVEGMRTAIGIKSGIADLAAARRVKGPELGRQRCKNRLCFELASGCKQGRDWREPEQFPLASRVYPSLVAVRARGWDGKVQRLKWRRIPQCLGVNGRRYRMWSYWLSANHHEQVHGTTRAAQESLASADRQLIDCINHHHLVAIEAVWTPSEGLFTE